MLSRSGVALARRAAFTTFSRRVITTTAIRRAEKKDDSHADHGHGDHGHGHGQESKVPTLANRGVNNMEKKIWDIEDEYDLLPEGAAIGTVPTDIEQSTGLERLEILGKMEGIDVFDMKPLPSDRIGTVQDPILIRSFGDEQYCGCTGCPADSHEVRWLTISRERPLGRCTECGSCYLMDYVGPEHVHEAHRTEPVPKSFADYIKPQYYYK